MTRDAVRWLEDGRAAIFTAWYVAVAWRLHHWRGALELALREQQLLGERRMRGPLQ